MQDGSETTPAMRRQGVIKVVADVLAGAITLLGIAWAADVPSYFGIALFREQLLAAVFSCVLALVYLRFPFRKDGEPRWYDIAVAAIGFLAGAYTTVRYPTLALDFYYLPTETFIVGIILLACLLEALRRVTGYTLLVLVGAFVLYALFANFAPGELKGRPQDFDALVSFLAIDNTALFGFPLYIITSIVLVYVFFGQLLFHSGGSAFFTDAATAMMGRYRGGSAKIATVASALFGSISGNSVSNVMATGVVTIPMMKKSGYKPEDAAAVEAAASTGGQLMPPIMGAAAFLVAEFLQISYGQVVVAALIPAFLYFLCVLIMADLTAARDGIKGVPAALLPTLGSVLRKGWPLILPFAVLVGSLFVLNRRAETAALYASGVIIVLGLLFSYNGQKLKFIDIWRALKETGELSVSVIVIGAMAGLVIGIMQLTGLGFGLTFFLVQLGQGSLFLMLLLTAAICILLGMGMPTTAVYFLLATLVAPPLVQLGVEPLAAHMFVMYFGMMSMLTPPVAFACFAAASIAQADPLKTGFKAVLFAWPAYLVPFLFVYSPTLIAIGSPVDIAITGITAALGVWFIAAGLMGFFLDRITRPMQVAFFVAGAAMLTPGSLFPGAFWVEMAGVVMAAGLAVAEIMRLRRSRSGEAVSPPLGS